MKERRIYSKNADYQRFEVMKTNRNKRYRMGTFLVEGVRNINEALKNEWRVESFLYSFETPLSHWASGILETCKSDINYGLTKDLMADLSNKEDTSELMAVIKMRENNPDLLNPSPASDNPVYVLFDRPSNKGNLGTIIRSCDGLGVNGLIATGHGVDFYDPEVVSASMGSFFKLPFVRIEESASVAQWIEAQKSRYPGFTVVGTSAHGAQSLFDLELKGPLLFLIGNETDGLSRNLSEMSDALASIPMATDSSASSFNVACAATVLLYEAQRQRMKG